jgi:hypothetical protein
MTGVRRANEHVQHGQGGMDMDASAAGAAKQLPTRQAKAQIKSMKDESECVLFLWLAMSRLGQEARVKNCVLRVLSTCRSSGEEDAVALQFADGEDSDLQRLRGPAAPRAPRGARRGSSKVIERQQHVCILNETSGTRAA